jgi:myo-inositol-1(or 4)-monophosphatase
MRAVSEASIAGALDEVADLVAAIARHGSTTGVRRDPPRPVPGSDVAADAIAVERCSGAGVGVLSEESGRTTRSRRRRGGRPARRLDQRGARRAVVRHQPVRGRCDGPLAAVVVDLPTGRRYEAVRGVRHGTAGPSSTVGVTDVDEASSGSRAASPPPRVAAVPGVGRSALDLCAVADGTLDGFVDCSPDAHGPWDYLGGAAGVPRGRGGVADALGPRWWCSTTPPAGPRWPGCTPGAARRSCVRPVGPLILTRDRAAVGPRLAG